MGVQCSAGGVFLGVIATPKRLVVRKDAPVLSLTLAVQPGPHRFEFTSRNPHVHLHAGAELGRRTQPRQKREPHFCREFKKCGPVYLLLDNQRETPGAVEYPRQASALIFFDVFTEGGKGRQWSSMV